METRLLGAALARRRGAVGIAVLAVAIGASVASALLHVSGDVSRKLSRELKPLGPNLLVVPAARESGRGRTGEPGSAAGFLDQAAGRAALADAGLEGVPLLYLVAHLDGRPVQLVGTDIAAARRLHPGWSVPPGDHASLMGARLMRRLGVHPGQWLQLELGGGGSVATVVGAPLEAGSADDEAWWIPLADAQTWSGRAGRVSLYQARVEGGLEAAAAARRAIERRGAVRALALHALSSTEAVLLERMRRLMALVTVAALVAAGLAAFGTLTDLALERRREIALMKALGAGRRDVVRQLAAEALAIGLFGGAAGWLFGLLMAEVIGREVFHSPIALRWDVPPLVLALALLVAGLASLGPIRLALAVEPAPALKGE